MFLTTIASVIGIAGGVKSLMGSDSPQQNGQQAAQASDPFGPFRTQYAQELNGQYNKLQNFDPNSITSNPEYQFQLQQGLGAIDKGAAASGMLGSGTRLMDLQKYGQGLASSFANTQYGRQQSLLQMLGQFSGATTGSMAGAGNALTQGGMNSYNQEQSGLGNIVSGLAGLGKGVNSGSGTGGYNGDTSGGGSNIWAGSGYGP